MPKRNLVSRADADAELAECASEIRGLGKQAIIEIGKRLIKAKALCRHGNWLPWLEREFGWSEQTARNYIAVADAAGKSPKFGDLAVPASALYLLAAPSTPAEVIEAVAEHSERLSLAEVKAIVAEVKARTAPEIEDISSDKEEEAEGKPEPRLVAFETAVQVAPVRQVRFPVTHERERVAVPYYVQQEQPALRTIKDVQRDRNRGRAEVFLRYLNWIAGNLAEQQDLGAIIETMSDEERDRAREDCEAVAEFKAALDENEMDVKVPDQLN